MVELLPCPFCGGARGRPMLDEIAEDHGGGWRVGCYGCGIFTAIPCTKEDAIAAWNRRPTQPVTQDAVIKALEMTRDHLTDAMTAAANAGFIAGATNDTLLECKSREQYLRLKPWLDAVKAALAQAVAGEREECAKVADTVRSGWFNGEATTAYGQAFQQACKDIAAAIRARNTQADGEKK